MRILLFTLFFIALLAFSAQAQYVNTDELVVVPGQKEPMALRQYTKKSEKEKNEYTSYLGQFDLPGNGGRVISGYGPRSGRMHYGTDLKMEKGDTVFAVQDGFLTRSGWGTGFGNIIVIQHENNIETYYAHLSKFLKHAGDRVSKGDAIALAGSTGRARGPHLHFEMHEAGRAFDPEMVFDFTRMDIREDARNFETLVALHSTLKPKGYAGNAAIPEFYKVRSGDSLWAISRKFKTPIREICQLNNLTENSVLQVGQPLKMY